MSYFDDDLADIIGSMAEFDRTTEAELDDEGFIEAPLIPLRDMVIFPRMVTPLFVGREKSLAAASFAQANRRTIICSSQIDPEVDDPEPTNIHAIGVEVALGRSMRLPDDSMNILVQGRRRVEIVEYVSDKPYFQVRARPIVETYESSSELEAGMRAVLALFEKCVQLNRSLPEDAYVFAMNVDDPGWLADLVATSISLTSGERQSLLEILDPAERLLRVSVLLGKELHVLELEDDIHSKVQQEVDKGQRELFLREQMRVIQGELGEGDIYQQELGDLREKIEKARMPEEIHQKALKELSRLSGMPPMAPEVGIIRTYLGWLTDLPWWETTEDNLDIAHAEKVLNAEHYGLEKAKERILEYIAVRRLAPEKMRSPILCFVGPPGTGKTSLGRSIAKALGREFVRLSLGGVRDEAEIRGHRRTYIGALPGRIIQTMRRAAKMNPLFMLDEIDKLGADFRGDPSAALLEVLDPEQNHAFSDHYLEVPYDLSRVMFITTANYLGPVPPALQDRMEVIEFPGYTEDEKLAIAQQFLVPRELDEHGIADVGLSFNVEALRAMVRQYTYEAGVRNLEREIATICRKTARKVAEGKSYLKRITADNIYKYLGPPRMDEPPTTEEDDVGVAMSVAWTEGGGDVMPVEVTLMPGKGTLILTGQMGDVMQESAQAAVSYMRSLAGELGVKTNAFDTTDIHIHVPEGAIPKDGPSAGITMATALISAVSGRKVRRDVVMTGEITLRGRVLAVGGIKEKVLTAHRIGVRDVIIPRKNEKDLVEIPRQARRDLNIIMVDRMEEVLETALVKMPEAPPRRMRKKS
jgi:ATP-dependent Lon protease